MMNQSNNIEYKHDNVCFILKCASLRVFTNNQNQNFPSCDPFINTLIFSSILHLSQQSRRIIWDCILQMTLLTCYRKQCRAPRKLRAKCQKHHKSTQKTKNRKSCSLNKKDMQKDKETGKKCSPRTRDKQKDKETGQHCSPNTRDKKSKKKRKTLLTKHKGQTKR